VNIESPAPATIERPAQVEPAPSRVAGQRRFGTILIVAGVVTGGGTAAGALVLRARTSFAASPAATIVVPTPPILLPVADSIGLSTPSVLASAAIVADSALKAAPVPSPAAAPAIAPTPVPTHAPAPTADVVPSVPLSVKGPAPAVVRPALPRTPAPVLARPRQLADSSRATRPEPAAVASPATPNTVARVAEPSVAPSGDSLFKLAFAAHTHAKLGAAQELYEKAIATKHAPAEAYNDYGVLLNQRGDPAAATEMFRQAVTRDDTNGRRMGQLGDSYSAANHHTEALSAFARAAQLDPARIVVKTRLAAEYQATGDTATARQFFADAVKLDPSDPASHHAFGMFLQSQRELPGAIREFHALRRSRDRPVFSGNDRGDEGTHRRAAEVRSVGSALVPSA